MTLKVEEFPGDPDEPWRIKVEMGMMDSIVLTNLLYKAKRYAEIMAKSNNESQGEFARLERMAKAWIGIIRPTLEDDELDDSVMTRDQALKYLETLN